MEMSNDEFVEAMSHLAKVHANIKRMIANCDRLKEIGWEDVTEREMEKMKGEDPDNSDVLHKAFEHPLVGIRYCYSEQEVVEFLDALEAHIP